MSTLSSSMVILMRTTSYLVMCELKMSTLSFAINITINKQMKNNVIARYCGISYILRLG